MIQRFNGEALAEELPLSNKELIGGHDLISVSDFGVRRLVVKKMTIFVMVQNPRSRMTFGVGIINRRENVAIPFCEITSSSDEKGLVKISLVEDVKPTSFYADVFIGGDYKVNVWLEDSGGSGENCNTKWEGSFRLTSTEAFIWLARLMGRFNERILERQIEERKANHDERIANQKNLADFHEGLKKLCVLLLTHGEGQLTRESVIRLFPQITREDLITSGAETCSLQLKESSEKHNGSISHDFFDEPVEKKSLWRRMNTPMWGRHSLLEKLAKWI